jgi:glycosyltransferase involved in cell wall biosynthesis
MEALEQESQREALSAEGDILPRAKVLFLIDELLGSGGAEGALSKIVRHLPRFGFSCAIGTFKLAKDPEFLSRFPCPIYDLPIRRVYDWQALRVALKLRKIVAQEQFDIIHTMFPASDLWAGPIAKFGSGALLVSGRRDLGIVRSPKHDLAYRWLRNQYDQVQAVSGAASQACILRDGLSAEKVFTVHNGVEVDKIRAVEPFPNLAEHFGLHPSGPTIVSSSGQLSHVKGVDVLIRAAAVVCGQLPEANFLIAGWTGNDYAREMQKLICSLGLESNVKLIGQVPTILSILKASDVFCLLSRSEGLSNALLEAMACGLPCVATSVGGNPEVVEEQRTGFLVKPEDVERPASHILDLLRNPSIRAEMGKNGQVRASEHFSVDAMVSRMATLYEQLLSERTRGKRKDVLPES